MHWIALTSHSRLRRNGAVQSREWFSTPAESKASSSRVTRNGSSSFFPRRRLPKQRGPPPPLLRTLFGEARTVVHDRTPRDGSNLSPAFLRLACLYSYS